MKTGSENFYPEIIDAIKIELRNPPDKIKISDVQKILNEKCFVTEYKHEKEKQLYQ